MNDRASPSTATPTLIDALERAASPSAVADAAGQDPMSLLLAWYADAKKSGRYEDFNATTLATATADGRPSARIVLCKALEPDPPALVFYTNYQSRKGRELESNPRAAAVFYWPHAQRQARVEGSVARVSPAESDAYFRTRPLLSRIGAAASRQSEPIRSRADLVAAAMDSAATAALAGGIARPEHWGGYRLFIDSVELWTAGPGRLHDRILWRRGCADGDGSWARHRLSP